jgi:putative membrane protein
MMNWGNYGWGMGFGWIFMIVFWVLVLLGMYFIVKTVITGGKGAVHGEAPIDTLKKRYARGEITKEEFERMKDDLMKS